MSCFKHTMLVVDYASKHYNDPEVTFAALMHDLGKKPTYDLYGNAHGHELAGLPLINSFCDKWKVPNSYRNLALLVCEYHTKVHGCMGRSTNDWMRPKSIMKLFEDTGALRNQSRFQKLLKACVADAKGRGNGSEQISEFENKPYHQYDYLLECLNAASSLDTSLLSNKLLTEGKSGITIGEVIRQERIKLIRGIQNEYKSKVN